MRLESVLQGRLAGCPALCRILVLIVLAVSLVGAAFAQQDVWKGGNGNWSDASNWSTGKLPTRSQTCEIDNGNMSISNVTVDTTANCLNLVLDFDDSLTIGPFAGLEIYGNSISNSSTITILSGNGLSIEAMNATLAGGSVQMSKGSRVSGAEFTLTNSSSVHGSGGFGTGTIGIINSGLIDANDSSTPLVVQGNGAGVTNSGVMQASSGGTLQPTGGLLSAPLNNTGGTIQALDGSTVQIFGSTITGGTLTTSGTGIFQVLAGNNTILNNLTNSGNYEVLSGANTIWEGTITNNGTFQAPGGGYLIDGSVTLTGAGKVVGGSGPLISIFSGPATLTNNETIQGGGSIGGIGFTNKGTINANNTSAALVFNPAPAANQGVMEASGGATLEIEDVLNNTGGTIQALNGSTVLLQGGTISGGTLSTSGTGSFQTTSGTLDGTVNVPTNAGLFVVTGGVDLQLKGTINNTGTISLPSPGNCLTLAAPTTLEGLGQVSMTPNTCFFATASTNNLVNKSTIAGAGSIGDSNPMGITNQGTIIANQTTPLLIVPASTGFLNSGRLFVNPGDALTIEGTFNNFASNKLSGGIYSIAGTLTFANANIITNASNLTLAGAAARLVDFSNNNGLQNLAANSGILALKLGQALASKAAAFTNSNTLTIDPTSSLSLAGSYTQTAGTTTVDGTLTAPTGFSLQAGNLLGKGKIAAAVTSNGTGTVTVGDSTTKPGILSVGSYTQGASAVLNISIGGTTVGTKYSQLASSNGVNLGGTLNIKRINGFVPVVGATFTIVTGSTVKNTFGTVNGLSINSSEHFKINYNANTVTLTVMSGP